MSVRGTLVALARGHRSERLLHTARLDGFGEEHAGEEAIRAAFRASPVDLSNAQLLQCGAHAALFAADILLFADLSGEKIGRLWRIGPGRAAARPRSVAVGFDPDLHQRRGDLTWSVGDHPELAAMHSAVEAAGRELVDSFEPGPRVRAFVIRAFSAGDEAAVLFALSFQGSVNGFAFAAAHLDAHGGRRIVRDAAGAATLAAAPVASGL